VPPESSFFSKGLVYPNQTVINATTYLTMFYNVVLQP